MRAVAVFIRGVGDVGAVMKKGRDSPGEIGVHGGGVAVLKAGVGHGNNDVGSGEAKLLGGGVSAERAVIAADNLGSGFVHQLER